MKPSKHDKTDFEKVVIGEFITGIIEDVQYEKEHKFKYKDNEKTSEAVRFKFKLDGYNHPHYSRWMLFFYGEKTSLFSKYLVKLVEGMTPESDFDIMALKNMPIKTIWSENGDFQNIDNIFPLKSKVKVNVVALAQEEEGAEPHDGDEGEESPPPF